MIANASMGWLIAFSSKGKKENFFHVLIAANLTSCLESGPQLKRSPKVVKHKDAAEFPTATQLKVKI